MITQAIINVVTGVWSFLWDHVPDLPSVVTDWLGGVDSQIDLFGTVIAPYLSVLHVWQPVPVVLGVVAAWAATWFVSVGVRVFRMIVSLFTGGGGSAT